MERVVFRSPFSFWASMGTMNPWTLEKVRRMTAVETAVLSVASLSATIRFESITSVSGNGFWERAKSARFKLDIHVIQALAVLLSVNCNLINQIATLIFVKIPPNMLSLGGSGRKL